jgi:plastocyanin
MNERVRGHSIAVKLAACLGLASLFGAGLALAGTSSVTLGSAGPQPPTVTAQWGDTVLFTNGGGEAHGVTIPRLTVASPSIAPGASWTHVFDGRTGNYIFRQTGARNFAGAIVVQLTGQVTMAATPATVTYGNRVTFRGTALAGFPVRLEELPTGQSGAWIERSTVEASTVGAWSTSLVPQIGGRYRASAAADQLRSPVLSVRVRPRIWLTVPRRAPAGRLVTVRVRVAPAGAAINADLERYDASRRRWVRADRRRLDRAGNASFRWRVVRGRSQLRVQLLRAGVRPGFESATGVAVSVTGT